MRGNWLHLKKSNNSSNFAKGSISLIECLPAIWKEFILAFLMDLHSESIIDSLSSEVRVVFLSVWLSLFWKFCRKEALRSLSRLFPCFENKSGCWADRNCADSETWSPTWRLTPGPEGAWDWDTITELLTPEIGDPKRMLADDLEPRKGAFLLSSNRLSLGDTLIFLSSVISFENLLLKWTSLDLVSPFWLENDLKLSICELLSMLPLLPKATILTDSTLLAVLRVLARFLQIW